MMNKALAIFCALILVGCADPERAERAKETGRFVVPGNYQAVFAHSRKMLAGCTGVSARLAVDGQIYNELRYAELTYSDAFWGPQMQVRYSPANGENTEVSVKVTGEMPSGIMTRRVEKWARGSNDC